MSESVIGARAAARSAQWCERIAEQERSGISVRAFCQQHELNAHSFYAWRKRLRNQEPVRFALVERRALRQQAAPQASLELQLVSGERLRIGEGGDPTTLRVVLEALRA